MTDSKPKPLFKPSVIALLVILTPIIYCLLVKLLLGPMEDAFYAYHRPDEYRMVAILIIIFFDIVWIVLAKMLWPRKYMQVKVILTLFVLTLSIAAISCFFVLNALEGAFA